VYGWALRLVVVVVVVVVVFSLTVGTNSIRSLVSSNGRQLQVRKRVDWKKEKTKSNVERSTRQVLFSPSLEPRTTSFLSHENHTLGLVISSIEKQTI
jgi:hypothetical protein